jgi:hypothetical protein
MSQALADKYKTIREVAAKKGKGANVLQSNYWAESMEQGSGLNPPRVVNTGDARDDPTCVRSSLAGNGNHDDQERRSQLRRPCPLPRLRQSWSPQSGRLCPA